MSSPNASSLDDTPLFTPECGNCTDGGDEDVPGWVLGVFGTLAVLSLLCCAVFMWMWYKKRQCDNEPQHEWNIKSDPLLHPTYGEGIVTKEDATLLQTIFTKHGKYTYPATEPLPGDNLSYPRGPGRVPVVVNNESEAKTTLHKLSNAHARCWYTKQGTVYDEILENVVLPTRLDGAGRGVVPLLGAEIDSDAPVTSLCTYLVTLEGVDIDRGFLHDDAPVWVPGNKSGLRAWSNYTPRNDAVYSNLDAAAEAVVATNTFGDPNTAYEKKIMKWVKTSILLSETVKSTPKHPKTVFFALKTRNNPDNNFSRGKIVFWLAPISCTVSYTSAMFFLERGTTITTTTTPNGGTEQKYLFKFMHVAEYGDVSTKSQYPSEEAVLLPMLSGFKIENICDEGGVKVVTLERVGHVDSVGGRKLRSEVLQDAARGENQALRDLEVVEEGLLYEGRNPPRKPRKEVVLHRFDKTGRVRMEDEGRYQGRCHECGGLAHDIFTAEDVTAIDAGKADPATTPHRLYVVGNDPAFSGCYLLNPPSLSWTCGPHKLVHMSHRWAVTSTTHPTHAFLISQAEHPITTLPSDIARWSRPVEGEWVEDPGVRVATTQPSRWELIGNPLQGP